MNVSDDYVDQMSQLQVIKHQTLIKEQTSQSKQADKQRKEALNESEEVEQDNMMHYTS